MDTTQSTTAHEHSPTLGALAKALATAQGKLEGAKKTAQNPHLKNKYATLADVWDACRAQLSAVGLAVVQTMLPSGERSVVVRTLLVHESGEWIASTLTMPVSKPDAQGYGSAITYARRYALAAMVGVTPDDDDAEAAVGRGEAKPVTRQVDAETRIRAMLDSAATADDLSQAAQAASKAVQAGALSDAARTRLREQLAAATARVSGNGVANGVHP